jgi:hypothetical protein
LSRDAAQRSCKLPLDSRAVGIRHVVVTQPGASTAQALWHLRATKQNLVGNRFSGCLAASKSSRPIWGGLQRSGFESRWATQIPTGNRVRSMHILPKQLGCTANRYTIPCYAKTAPGPWKEVAPPLIASYLHCPLHLCALLSSQMKRRVTAHMKDLESPAGTATEGRRVGTVACR